MDAEHGHLRVRRRVRIGHHLDARRLRLRDVPLPGPGRPVRGRARVVFVPATVLAVPLYFMVSETGLSNTLLAMILPALVNPFGVFLMTVFAEAAIPDELLDAGRVDGASEARIFAGITFRLLLPGFVTVVLFAFVGAWNNFFLPLLVLSNPDLFPVTVGLANWAALATQPGNIETLYAIVITGSVVAILPVMALFLILQRYWQRGLALGSVRG